MRTAVTFGKGRYDAKTALTLERLSVRGAAGDTLFKQQFGIPLSLALALLRDPSGNIALDIPVTIDEAGTKVGLGTVLAGALRSAILGAVTSPLKGLGMVFGSGGGELSLDARLRIVRALEERAAGGPGDLDADDAARLDRWLAERPAASREALRALAAERAATVTAALRDRHVHADRLTSGPPNGEPREGVPGVLVAFAAAEE